MKKIIIAPDSYKESLSAKEAAEIIGRAFQLQFPNADIILAPMADGGEGTLDCFLKNTEMKVYQAKVQGPLGESISARYGILKNNTAVIELAEASGLSLLPIEKRNPFNTSSYGTGELIRIALDKGIRKFIICLGGSATTDGGLGLLQALGFQFTDKKHQLVSGNGEGLCQLAHINTKQSDARLSECDFLLAHDVNNPLTGNHGAIQFVAQKGGTELQIQALLAAYDRYATYLAFFKNVGTIPGTGAAGGIAAGLFALLPAKLIAGSELVMDLIKLKDKIQNANLIITGEGKMDNQTIQGKVAIAVAQLAKTYHIPTIAIVAQLGHGYHEVYEGGINAVFSIAPGPISHELCLKHTQSLLFDAASNIARLCEALHF